MGERILDPLQMTSTAITPSEDMRRRLASGHDARGRPAPYLHLPTLAGAGALLSSITDLLRFAAANLDDDGDPIHRAMAATHSLRKRIRLVTRIGLNWHILGSRARTILSHAGGTAGFSSLIGLHPARRTAIVVLSNSRQTLVEDIGLHLLEKRLPLLPPPKQRSEITLAPELLERYVGVYDLAGAKVQVTRSPEGLAVQAPGEETDRLYPETKTSFLFKAMDAQVTFTLDRKRRVTGAVLHQDGHKIRAKKIA